MYKRNIFLIKIGGSTFLPKNMDDFFDKDYIKKISEIINILKYNNKIILHGTGNVGHGFVKKNGLNQDNFMILRNKLDKMFLCVDNYFKDYKRLYAKDIVNNKCGLLTDSTKIIAGGDIDDDLNIISSDDLMAFYINKYDIKNSFMLTDIDGALDNNGKLIKTISSKTIKKTIFWKKEGDVTGSMQKKIEKLFEYNLTQNHKVNKTIWIINGYNLKNFVNILNTGEGIGTKILI